MNSKNFYITSPIYYVNDVPHIGHAYTSIACDVMARYKKLQNFDVFFLTGTDEHGQKVEKSAKKNQKNPEEFCDQVSQKFRNLAKNINLSNNDFIRTTELRHKKSAQKIWKKLEDSGFIYKGTYEGWYATRDEAFYLEDEIIDGKAPTGAEVEWHKEESYFFKLSAFQDKLLALYEAAPDFIRPKSRYNEVVSFVKSGLRDLSISRTSFFWGVPVLGDDKHIMYVWLDALTNYLSALDYAEDENNEKFQKFWNNGTSSPIHVVGKDILRFHGVYWPAFLMAAGINLPYGIFAHGWWTNEGQKISKSVGNVIDPNSEISWLESLGCNNEVAVDYFRYFLLREVHFGNDGDYSRQNLVTRVNADLANNIGNLAQRSLSMIFKNSNGEILQVKENFYEIAEKFIEDFEREMEKFAYDRALAKISEFSSLANKNFDEKAPWNLRKEGKIDEMNLALFEAAESIRIISILLKAFVPNTANKILDSLNIPDDKRNFANLKNSLKIGDKINEPKASFPRLN